MTTTVLFWVIVFIVSLAVLLYSADKFTEAASRIGVMMKLPTFVVGVIIVSIGTSLPELLTGISGVLQGASEIAVSNAIGSNIANIFLVLGVASLAAKKKFGVKRSLIDLDLPLLALATTLVVFMAWDGTIAFPEAVLLVIGYGIYLFYVRSFHKSSQVPLEKRASIKKTDIDTRKERRKEALKAIAGIVVFGVGLALASNYIVKSTIELATIFNISTAVITASAIAIGTSLPELTVSIFAVRKGSYELVMGNVLGSNIFNLLIVIALPAFFGALVVDPIMISVGLPFLIASTILVVFSGISQRIHGYEGSFYLLLYILFTGMLFGLI